jgi:predicted N-formylglutamate amidohydrolase
LSLRRLGLEEAELERHIACDIGIEPLGVALAGALDACFIRQAYSRLVIDCNRRPGAEGSIAEVSDGAPIPGNRGLSPQEIAARQMQIYQPYQDAIAAELDRRARAGVQTLFVSLHSFTPVMAGFARPWKAGVLHRDDSRLSHHMLRLLRRELDDAAGDNQPYRLDVIDNTVPLHADPRGLDYLEIELRQDWIGEPEGRAEAVALLARLLPEALEAGCGRVAPPEPRQR